LDSPVARHLDVRHAGIGEGLEARVVLGTSLEFIEGQIVVKYAVTLVFGIPLVLALRRFVRPAD
jgi:hypothetical protein